MAKKALPAVRQTHDLDLRPFTISADGPLTPVARLSMGKEVLIWINPAAFELVTGTVGRDVDVAFDPDTGRVAITRGVARKVGDGGTSDWPRIRLSAIRDFLEGIYGRCRRVYFNVERYDNAIELVPNGRVGK